MNVSAEHDAGGKAVFSSTKQHELPSTTATTITLPTQHSCAGGIAASAKKGPLTI